MILGFSKYSVLGWSDGGIVGLILTGEQQEAVEKLVVFGSNASPPQNLISPTQNFDFLCFYGR